MGTHPRAPECVEGRSPATVPYLLQEELSYDLTAISRSRMKTRSLKEGSSRPWVTMTFDGLLYGQLAFLCSQLLPITSWTATHWLAISPIWPKLFLQTASTAKKNPNPVLLGLFACVHEALLSRFCSVTMKNIFKLARELELAQLLVGMWRYVENRWVTPSDTTRLQTNQTGTWMIPERTGRSTWPDGGLMRDEQYCGELPSSNTVSYTARANWSTQVNWNFWTLR